MTELSTTVDRDLNHGVIVVHLTGLLSLTSRGRAHQSIAKCLTEAPNAVIVDLAAVSLSGRADLPFFVHVQHTASREPPVLLLWCAGGELAEWLGTASRGLLVYPTVEAATVAALANPTAERWVHGSFAGREAATAARLLVGDACVRWGLSRVLHPMRLVVSELVTNAVEHAGGDVDVTARARVPYLVTTVRDRSFVPPRKVRPSPEPSIDERGRGLHIVEHYATAWGWVRMDSGGKAVWATMRTHPIGTR